MQKTPEQYEREGRNLALIYVVTGVGGFLLFCVGCLIVAFLIGFI